MTGFLGPVGKSQRQKNRESIRASLLRERDWSRPGGLTLNQELRYLADQLGDGEP